MDQHANAYLILKEQVRIRAPLAQTPAVQHALRMLLRDFAAVLGVKPKLVGADAQEAELHIRYASKEELSLQRPEAFGFRFVQDGAFTRLDIIGFDDLGIIYGILQFSRTYLGVEPFWFWADQPIKQLDELKIPCDNYDAPAPKVRFRGWFVNDEVCLIGWKDGYPPSREVWEPVFEALLRCGGNMVIPGTDLPRDGIHYELAAEMGLWITHHHAEPLGAEMFLRAYPGKQASYQSHPDLFEALWEEAIDKQKDKQVVWVLSFRGQGDQPFWEQDPSFDTPEKRGKLISQVIRKQYDMIHQAVQSPVCSVALYGEISELYKGGYIDLPDDVIKVWADNGYGKMVSRRHGNLNLRVPSLPAHDDAGKHGIYFHVTFHDLQASNHLTMFPGPASFLKQELEAAITAGADEYVLLNCGNIRPHLYPLDIVRELWSAGRIETSEHLKQFVRSYYEDGHDQLEQLYLTYADAAISYGSNFDDWAGEEYYHHPARKMIGHWMTGKCDQSDERLIWAVGDAPFDEQVKRFEQKLEAGIRSWQAWLAQCDQTIDKLAPGDAQRASDHLRLHGALHLHGCEGFYWLCRSYAEYDRQQYPQAFVHASQSLWHYQQALAALRQAEHGKWENFYRADWLTNIALTCQHVDALRKFLRMHGDSPDFFLWYKEYLMPVTEKYIYLENTHRNPLSDDELAMRLQKHFEREAAASESN